MELIVLDGPIGTMLEHLGVPTPPPLWSGHAVRHAPRALADLHRAYARAGATVHTAATFRTAPRTAGADADALTREAVALCRDAVPEGHRVAGSLAPLLDCWRPDLAPADPGPEHARQAERLATAGVDLLLVETFASPREAIAATRAAVRTGLPVWTALTPGFALDLLSPTELAQAARAVVNEGASRVLVNCLPAARAAPWIAALAAAGHPWGVYANAGGPEEGLRHGTPGAAARYAALAADWVRQGAEVIGGCCGTGPAHITALASLANGSQEVDDRADDSYP